jgi:hypothetical protein
MQVEFECKNFDSGEEMARSLSFTDRILKLLQLLELLEPMNL